MRNFRKKTRLVKIDMQNMIMHEKQKQNVARCRGNCFFFFTKILNSSDFDETWFLW